jgi:hypothetical protein
MKANILTLVLALLAIIVLGVYQAPLPTLLVCDGSSRAKALLERLCQFLDYSLLHGISSRKGHAYGPAYPPDRIGYEAIAS